MLQQTRSNSNTQSVDQAVAPLLDGTLSDSRSDETVEVINPSTGQRFLSIPKGCDADVDRAVASARRAFDDGRWSDAPPSFRKKTLQRLADLIEKEGPALDALDAGEMGKPVGEAWGNAATSASRLRFFAEAVDKVAGDLYISDKNSFVAQRRVPRGVIGAVVPWNFPAYCAVMKIGPALAAGNCMVLKPSEMSSRSALRIGQLALEAGIPPGVLNVVPGVGQTVGRALGLHMDVDMMTFTGSTVVGKLMMQYSGQSNLKVVMAECGGKSPQIVFADGVDLDQATQSIAQFLLVNQGQICSVGSRLLVQRSVESQVIEKIVARMQKIVVGDAMDPKTTFGPLVSEKQCTKVMHYIESGSAEGAQLVAGGKRISSQSGGYFVEPTVFRNVSPTAKIAQEEIFGPVLSVIPFDTVDDAIRIANGTMYGLAAYVWTANLTTGMKMAKGIRSTVMINAAAPSGEGAGFAAAGEPFGQSGMGSESGLAGMESYMRRHMVAFNHG